LNNGCRTIALRRMGTIVRGQKGRAKKRRYDLAPVGRLIKNRGRPWVHQLMPLIGIYGDGKLTGHVSGQLGAACYPLAGSRDYFVKVFLSTGNAIHLAGVHAPHGHSLAAHDVRRPGARWDKGMSRGQTTGPVRQLMLPSCTLARADFLLDPQAYAACLKSRLRRSSFRSEHAHSAFHGTRGQFNEWRLRIKRVCLKVGRHGRVAVTDPQLSRGWQGSPDGGPRGALCGLWWP